MNGCIAILLLLLPAVDAAPAADQPKVVVGSKSFTESTILAEAATLLAREAGCEAVHRRELGGSLVLWKALRAGDLDLYPEYTGTLLQETLASEKLSSAEELPEALAKYGVGMTKSLGFQNGYAIGMSRDRAKELGIASISDLREHPGLRLGFSSEFLNREDGWPSLRAKYGLPQRDVVGMEHSLTYAALDGGQLDAIDLFTTDPNIARFHLISLEDDREHFPEYEAVYVYRLDLEERAPAFVARLKDLEGRVSEEAMTRMNAQVDVESQAESDVAAEFLTTALGAQVQSTAASLPERVGRRTLEHLFLSGVSLALAILVALPLGVLGSKRRWLGHASLMFMETVQTIPGLALLVLLGSALSLLSLSMMGPLPAILALFLYSLLPIYRNTLAGMQGIAAPLRESAEALGLSRMETLRLVELPLAAPMILTGIKITAVINVGYAALGGLIGAGGYGQTIMEGLRRLDVGVIAEGAIPAALLALVVKFTFEAVERALIPQGLRTA
jgi:osmoprotectant transport system permease protein